MLDYSAVRSSRPQLQVGEGASLNFKPERHLKVYSAAMSHPSALRWETDCVDIRYSTADQRVERILSNVDCPLLPAKTERPLLQGVRETVGPAMAPLLTKEWNAS